MRMNYRNTVLSSAAAVCLTAYTAPVFAQSNQQTAQSGLSLEEVVVTARRTEENIQRVPISVIALSEDKMTDLAVFDTASLQKVLPGYSSSVGDSGQYVWMRGMLGIAGQYADAPYTIRTEGTNYDIGSFQVLKGPQGTRFGQSSAAGAIVIDPKRPVNNFEGFVKGGVGTYGMQQLQGMVNVPLLDDKLLFRVAGDWFGRNGYVKAPEIGKSYHDESYFAVRPSLTWKISDSIENYTMLSYYYNRNNGRLGRSINYRPGSLNHIRNPELPFTSAQTFENPPGRGMYEIRNVDTRDGFSGERDKTVFLVNQTMWDINDTFSVKNIFSFYTESRRSVPDAERLSFNVDPGDLSAAAVEQRKDMYVRNTWSDELIAYGNFMDGKIKVNVGTIHKAVDQPVEYTIGAGGGVLSAFASKGIRNIPKISRAVYGSANIDLSDYTVEGLNLELGARKTWDSHQESRWTLVPNAAAPLSQWGPRRTAAQPDGFETKSAHFSYQNYLVGLQWQATPQTMYYVTASQGTTFGQVFLSLPAALQIVKPEKLQLLEGGFKSTFDVGTWQIRANASAYYGLWKDVQVESHIVFQVNPPPAPTQLVPYQSNAAEALVRGIDFSFEAVPTDWLKFGFTGAFNKNRFSEYMSVDANNNPIDYSYRGMVGQQDFKYVADATVYLPLDPSYGRIGVSVNWVHQSAEMADGGTNDPSLPKTVAITVANGYPAAIANGELRPTNVKLPYGIMDAGIQWDDIGGNTSLRGTFSVTNVLGQTMPISGGNAWAALGLSSGQAHPPRMFSFTMSYAF
jgi:iron complex outermembrane receptor protein